jgi:hypothetical protein
LTAGAAAQEAPAAPGRAQVVAVEPVAPGEPGTPRVPPCIRPGPTNEEGELPAPPPPPGGPEREIGFLYPLETWQRPDGSAFGTLFGLGATLTDVRGGLGQRAAAGAIAHLGATGTFAEASGFTGHLRGSGYLGGGSGGFEGGLAGAFYLGQRLNLGRSDGPLARIGTSGLIAGNRRLYESRLALPEAQIAYQLFTDDFFFEAGARGGLVLAGRFDPLDGAGRALGGRFDVGPYAWAWTRRVRLELEGHRFVGRGGEGDVDLARASLCLPFGAVTACLDGRHTRGDVPRGDGSHARVAATYAGLVIGANPGE